MGQAEGATMARVSVADNLVRISQNGSNQATRYFKLSVPREIAEALPREILYTCELTDEGLLYRPVHTQTLSDIDLPAWAKEYVQPDPAA
jgi:hypothetical protein